MTARSARALARRSRLAWRSASMASISAFTYTASRTNVETH